LDISSSSGFEPSEEEDEDREAECCDAAPAVDIVQFLVDLLFSPQRS
jgi:hypothetical protein